MEKAGEKEAESTCVVNFSANSLSNEDRAANFLKSRHAEMQLLKDS